MAERRFRTVYIAQPSHDFSAIKGEAEVIKFVTTGYEDRVNELLSIIDAAMGEFDPDKDAFIAVGKVNTCFLIGQYLGRKHNHCTLGVFVRDDERGGTYKWEKMQLK